MRNLLNRGSRNRVRVDKGNTITEKIELNMRKLELIYRDIVDISACKMRADDKIDRAPLGYIAKLLVNYHRTAERVLCIINTDVDKNTYNINILEIMSRELKGVRPYVISHGTKEMLRDLGEFRDKYEKLRQDSIGRDRMIKIAGGLEELHKEFNRDIKETLKLLK